MTRVEKVTLAPNVSLYATVMTEVDVIKTLEYVLMGCVPMDGVEQIVNKVRNSKHYTERNKRGI